MGLFPTDAGDGDEVTNANGTTFKYVAADDKWIIVSDIVVSDIAYNAGTWDANPDAASKDAIRDKVVAMDALIDANTTVAEVEGVITAELVDGQSIDNRIDALITAEGHPDHNNLTGLNAGDVYEHISQAQKTALHPQLTNLNELATRNHNDLLNIDAGDINHLTDAQVAVLRDATKIQGKTIDVAALTDNKILKYDLATTSWKCEVDAGEEGGIANVVEDESPQLGGDLDLNGFNLDFPSVVNISDVKDEDDMASNSATMLATQQSIKAFVNALILSMQQSIPINLINLAGGTLFSNFGTQPIIAFPAADNNCYAAFQGHMPIGWDDMVNPTLVYLYASTTTDSWIIEVKADAGTVGESGTTNNLYNNYYNISTTTINQWHKKEVVLTGTISPGDVVGVKISKTSVDSHIFYMAAIIWIKRS